MFQTWNCIPTANKLTREINWSSKSQERIQDEEMNRFTYKALAGFIRFSNHNVKYFLSYWKAQPLRSTRWKEMCASSSTATTSYSSAGKALRISAQLTAPGYKFQQEPRTSTSVSVISGTASVQNSWKTPTTVACSELAEFAATATAETGMRWDVRNTKWHATGNVTLSFPCCHFLNFL